jgi:ribosome biogenesis GTPase
MQSRQGTDLGSSPLSGEIVAAFGRRFHVAIDTTETLECVTRGRRSEFACGDRVRLTRTNAGQGVIEDVFPRTSLLYRSDAFRQKLIAANVDQVIFVLAGKPSYSDELLSRCLIACEAAQVSAIVVLNKSDLIEETATARRNLAWITELGYPLLPLCAKRNIEPLEAYLQGKLSVLIGQSGMGKSTIINTLIPGAAARVDEFSIALDAGKHTTTNARVYRLDPTSRIIDSPGLQEFGLFHLSNNELAHAVREFRPYLGKCRFQDCRHVAEPNCAVVAAAKSGGIRESRLALYQRLVTLHAEWRVIQRTQGR